MRWHMCERRVCSQHGLFSTAVTFAAALAAFASTAMASTPDLSGQWGRDNGFFEPPLAGPGPVAPPANADGTIDLLHAGADLWNRAAGNPILKPQAAEAVK